MKLPQYDMESHVPFLEDYKSFMGLWGTDIVDEVWTSVDFTPVQEALEAAPEGERDADWLGMSGWVQWSSNPDLVCKSDALDAVIEGYAQAILAREWEQEKASRRQDELDSYR